jgi:hypothetical protein
VPKTKVFLVGLGLTNRLEQYKIPPHNLKKYLVIKYIAIGFLSFDFIFERCIATND